MVIDFQDKESWSRKLLERFGATFVQEMFQILTDP